MSSIYKDAEHFMLTKWRFSTENELHALLQHIAGFQTPYRLHFIAPGVKSKSDPLGLAGEIGMIFKDERF